MDSFHYYDDFFINMINLLLIEDKKVISIEGKQLLKRIEYKKDNNNICPITLEGFIEKEVVIKLPCNHVFKEQGIMKWLVEENNKCPVCRYELPSVKKDNYKKILEEEHKTVLNHTFLTCIKDI